MIKKIFKSSYYSEDAGDGVLSLYRKKIFSVIFLVSLIGALPPFYLNLNLSISQGNYLNATIYTSAYLIAVAVIFFKIVPFTMRAWAGLLLFYFMGLVGLVAYGPEASGRVWLFMFAILTTLILGLKAGLAALTINVVTILMWAWAWSANYFSWSGSPRFSQTIIFTTTSSFLFMTALVTVSLGVFLNFLKDVIDREQELSTQLRRTNKRLKEESEELKQARNAHQESEERFRLFIQQVPGYVFIKDHQGRYLYFNDKCLEFFGLSLEDALGKSIDEVHRPEKANLYKETDKVLLETGEPLTLTEEIVNPTGERAVMLNHKFLIHRENKPPLIAGIYLDVTKRIEAEEAIKNSEAKFRLVVERASEGIIVIQDNRYKFVNDYMLDIFKMSRQEVLSSELMAMVHPDDRPMLLDRVKKRMTGQPVPEVVEHRIIDGEGNVRWVETRGVLSDWDGRPASIAFATDITERREFKVTIRQSEDRFRSLVEMAPEPIFVHHDGEILYANQSFFTYLGVENLERLKGIRVWDFAAPNEKEAARERSLRLQETGMTASLQEFNLITLDGRKIVCESTGRGVVYDSKPSVVTMWRDISDRKIAENEMKTLQEQLHQAHKMESLGTLAGGIAHDFNNILTAIMGYSELALDISAEGENPRTELHRILSSAQRAKDLVTQILTFSRKMNTELKIIDLNKVIYQTKKMLERIIPRMVRIELILPNDLRPISADPGQISQLLMNLGANSSDAMPQGGQLTFRTDNVTINDDYNGQLGRVLAGEYVRLIVTDTGHGMDQETLPHIFDPFFTKKEIGKGTGLGLSTAYGIVKNHNGYITCKSELAKGTTFEMYFPAVRSTEKTEQLVEIEKPDFERGEETILIVDDEEAIRDLGSIILAHQGYRILLAASGEEALATYADKWADIDLVILDISMPGMGGHNCLQELLKINPAAKAIISSGYSLSGKLNDIIHQGASGFVPKPFTKSEILKTVRQILDG